MNISCKDHGRRGGAHLAVAYRYGAEKQYRGLVCRTCEARSSERKGTALFRSYLSQDKAISVLENLAEGDGIRKTGRLVKVHRDTVMRYGRLAGEHAHDLHDELVAFSPRTREVQLDEKWSFVGKEQEDCDPDDPADAQEGDWWDHVAYDPEHRLVVSVVPGRGRPRMPRRWSRTSSGGPGAGPWA